MSCKNLLFVFADQWRRMAMGCAGQDPVLTPRMDAFAYPTAPACLPDGGLKVRGCLPTVSRGFPCACATRKYASAK